MEKINILKISAGLFLLFLLGSCIGIGSEITIRRDGSGTINLEYKLSRDLESLGKQGGNESWPIIPVGRADFERTAAAISGLRLRSFTTKTTETDVVNRIGLDFSDTAALVQFLDASGYGASLIRENNQNRLVLVLGSGAAVDANLAELAAAACEGYSLDLSFNLPGDGELLVTDRNGQPLDRPNWKVSGGKKPAFSAPMGDLLGLEGPLRLELRWGL